jgi:hypothetical protein
MFDWQRVCLIGSGHALLAAGMLYWQRACSLLDLHDLFA